MHLNKLKFGMAVTAGVFVMATAQAVVQDTVTFSGFNPVQTETYTNGTLFQRTSPVSYVLGRVDYNGDTTEINGTTNDWVADHEFRAVYPGGSPAINQVFGAQLGYTGTQNFAGSFFINSGATVPLNGVWDFYFINNFDDAPTGQVDSVLNFTVNFTDEVPGAPANTPVTVDPNVNASSTVALNISAGGVTWYKVSVVNPTNAIQYLDISTNSVVDNLDFGWYDNAGTWIWDIAGFGANSVPGLSFGGAGNYRPTIGPFLPNGQHGNVASGTYYLAVSYSDLAPGNGWLATTTNTTSTYSGFVRFDTGTSTPPSAPPSIDVPVDPNVSATTSAALTVTAGGITWYKVTVANPTTASRYLDISTDNSAQDLDFGWYSSTGTLLFDIDGTSPTWEPGLSFGGSTARPAIGTFVPNGQHGNVAAASYYLAVCFYNFSGANGWIASTNDAVSTWTGVVRFDTGDASPPPVPPGLIDQIGPDNTGQVGQNAFASQNFEAAFNIYDIAVIDDFKLTAPVSVTSARTVIDGYGAGFVDFANITSFQVNIYSSQLAALANLAGDVYTTTVPYAGATVDTTWGVGQALVTIPVSINLVAGDYYMSVIPENTFGTNGQIGVVSSTYATGLPMQANMRQVNPAGGFALPGNNAQVPNNAAYDLIAGGGTTASGTVDFGQLGGTPYNSGTNLPTSIPVSFRDASNTEIATGSATYNPVTGAFSATVPGSVTVPYRVSFKHGFWLRKTMPNPVDPAAPVGNYAFGTVAPQVGDADDDNAVTPSDYGIWQVANGTFPTENTSADFDGDGAVTPSDYGLWQINNGAFGDD